MGQSKALLVFEGQSLLRRAYALLQRFDPDPLILCGPFRAELEAELAAHYVDDPGEGPAEALRQLPLKLTHQQRLLVIPVDMPGLNLELLQRFVTAADGGSALLGPEPNRLPALLDRRIFETTAPSLGGSFAALSPRRLLIEGADHIDAPALVNINNPKAFAAL